MAKRKRSDEDTLAAAQAIMGGTSMPNLSELLDANYGIPTYSPEWDEKIGKPVRDRISQAQSSESAKAIITQAAEEYASQHVGGFSSLKELYAKVKSVNPQISKDEFLNTVMQGSQAGEFNLHPFTGAKYELKPDDYDFTIPAGNSLMQYVEVAKRKGMAGGGMASSQMPTRLDGSPRMPSDTESKQSILDALEQLGLEDEDTNDLLGLSRANPATEASNKDMIARLMKNKSDTAQHRAYLQRRLTSFGMAGGGDAMPSAQDAGRQSGAFHANLQSIGSFDAAKAALKSLGVDASFGSSHELAARRIAETFMAAHKMGLDIPKKVFFDSDLRAHAAIRPGQGFVYGPEFVRGGEGFENDWLKEEDKYGRDLSTHDPHHIPMHEIGHFNAGRTQSNANEMMNNYWNPERIRKEVSEKAASEPNEFIPEIFAGTMLGRKYSSEMMDLFKSLGGKLPKGMAGGGDAMPRSVPVMLEPGEQVTPPSGKGSWEVPQLQGKPESGDVVPAELEAGSHVTPKAQVRSDKQTEMPGSLDIEHLAAGSANVGGMTHEDLQDDPAALEDVIGMIRSGKTTEDIALQLRSQGYDTSGRPGKMRRYLQRLGKYHHTPMPAGNDPNATAFHFPERQQPRTELLPDNEVMPSPRSEDEQQEFRNLDPAEIRKDAFGRGPTTRLAERSPMQPASQGFMASSLEMRGQGLGGMGGGSSQGGDTSGMEKVVGLLEKILRVLENTGSGDSSKGKKIRSSSSGEDGKPESKKKAIGNTVMDHLFRIAISKL